MTDELPADRFMSGVYYDGTVGEFYQFDHDEQQGVVNLTTPDGEQVESLSDEEFVEHQPDLYPVPEEATERPVRYFENWVNQHRARAEMDVGFMYADRQTAVVQTDEVDDE